MTGASNTMTIYCHRCGKRQRGVVDTTLYLLQHRPHCDPAATVARVLALVHQEDPSSNDVSSREECSGYRVAMDNVHRAVRDDR